MEYKYEMSLSLNVLNHLGINLYSNIPAVLSEIVANSWDADASIVKITIEQDTITIEDNGCGMDVEDINRKFLYVGHRKREESKVSPKFARAYMGRKGIGKLSMFSIADVIEVYSRKAKTDGSFDSNALRTKTADIEEKIKHDASSQSEGSYHPEELSFPENCISETGTKIVLSNLKKSTSSLTADYIRKRVARRFGIIGSLFNFSVIVNGTEVSIEDREYYKKLSCIWYFGEESSNYANNAINAENKEPVDNCIVCNERQYKITGWIGSVDSAGDLKDGTENLNKIVIIVRGKVGQEDILSEYSEGGLYSKYLIGEINADFFDDDEQEDMATSNRQEYRQDDERFIALKEFIYAKLKYIQGKWTELRNESGEKKAIELLPDIQTWVSSLQGDDKAFAKKIFGKINQINADEDKKREIIKYGILAFEKLRYTHRLSALDAVSSDNFEFFCQSLTGLDEIEAMMYYQITKERMEVIKTFQKITDENALEKVIQKYLFDHLWLLDPSWERNPGTEFCEKRIQNALDVDALGLTQEQKEGRVDLGYRKTAGKHLIIELKRANRVITRTELLDQIGKYSDTLSKVLEQIEGGSYSYEIIVVLGKPVDNDPSPNKRGQIDHLLEEFHARVVYYSELIENALKAYSEYIEANKKNQLLIDLFEKLEPEE